MRQHDQTRPALSAPRRAAGSTLALPHAYAKIGFLVVAGYELLFGVVADGPVRWAAWGTAAALAGLAAGARPAGGWRTDRCARAVHRPRVTQERPRIIREPESGWWEMHPEPTPTAMTVAVVAESETPGGTEAVVSRLAELAVTDELVIVYGSERWSRPRHHGVVVGLRDHLPRHHVVAMRIAQPGAGLEPEDAALLNQFLENGSLPVVVTPASAMHDIAAELSSSLRADRVVRACRTADGADLQQVWRRATANAN